MSESKHTPEPWSLPCTPIVMVYGPNGERVCRIIDNDEDGRRIVACVNAMAGMEDPERDMAALDKDMRDLTAENAALRAKLEMIRDRDWVENALNPQWAADVARAALAEIKEES